MKKVLILCVHRPNRSPSQRFRFEQYIRFLEEHGYSFRFSYLLNEKQDRSYYHAGSYLRKLQIVISASAKRIRETLNAHKYDLVFVQREAFMLGTPFFEQAIGARVPMVFDFDDSIWLQNVSEGNKKLAFLKNAAKTSKIIQKASLVLAGNQYLADYAKKYNQEVVIVPTTIDTQSYQCNSAQLNDKRPICIGWSGSFTTIEHFETALPVLKKIKEKYKDGVRFMILGDGNYYCKELDTQGLAWKAQTEVEDLCKMDIGIMPLPDTEWAKGKCGLKGLQYMALGIPSLMSPVGVNIDIIQNTKNGFLPSSEEEWVLYLSQLIENPGLRQKIGEAGRETVVEKYSVKAWQAKYLDYFNQLTRKNK